MCLHLVVSFLQTSSVGEAQKLVAQASDLLSAINSSIQHGIQSQNDTTKGGNGDVAHNICIVSLQAFRFAAALHISDGAS